MVREGNLLAVFNSGHRVMKAERIVKERGLPALLIPAPRQLQTDCGLALRFEEEQRATIMSELEREDLLPEFVVRYAAAQYTVIWTHSAESSKETATL
jgi:hypothetical protein